jgi:glycosyltransferase involved in cell wall biosynthesis
MNERSLSLSDDAAIMNVSIIIPAYNNHETIREVLIALMSQKYELGQIEIIVINDHSKDTIDQDIMGFPVTCVLNETNLGLAKSLNKGLALSKYDIVVTLHGDVIPIKPSWLQQLVLPLKEPNVAAACSTQFSPNFKQRHETIWEKLLYGKQSIHVALNDKADAYNKLVLNEIGMFDEKTYRTAGEDEDLALRLTLNRKIIRSTQAEVIHNHYFVSNGTNVLRKILKREYQFGVAGGALRRKYPFYKPRAYILPESTPPTTDGIFKVALCIGALIPFAQIAFIPLIFFAASKGITKLEKQKKLLILYPFFNVARFATYTIGYCVGIAKGKQE